MNEVELRFYHFLTKNPCKGCKWTIGVSLCRICEEEDYRYFEKKPLLNRAKCIRFFHKFTPKLVKCPNCKTHFFLAHFHWCTDKWLTDNSMGIHKSNCKKCSKKKTPVKMSKMKYFFKRLIYYLRFLKLTLRKELFIVSDYDFEDICIFYEPNELIIYENDIEFSNSIYSYNFNKKEFEQIA